MGAIGEVILDPPLLSDAQCTINIVTQQAFDSTAVHGRTPMTRRCFARSRRPRLIRDFTVP